MEVTFPVPWGIWEWHLILLVMFFSVLKRQLWKLHPLHWFFEAWPVQDSGVGIHVWSIYLNLIFNRRINQISRWKCHNIDLAMGLLYYLTGSHNSLHHFCWSLDLSFPAACNGAMIAESIVALRNISVNVYILSSCENRWHQYSDISKHVYFLTCCFHTFFIPCTPNISSHIGCLNIHFFFSILNCVFWKA